MVNGVTSSEDSLPVVSSSPSSESSSCSSVGVKPPNSRPRSKRCSLIREEIGEEDEEAPSENGFGFDEVKECRSANELTSADGDSGVRGKPSSPGSQSTANTRLLQTVHSMPQLMLNQISEEDEGDEMSCSFSAYPQHQPMFSIADAGDFGGCARKANRKSSTKKTAPVQSAMASAPSLSRKSGRKQGKDLPDVATKETLTDSGRVAAEADGRPWTSVVGQRRIGCSSSDDEDDSSILVGHFCLRHEPVRQHSLVQSTSDTEGFTDVRRDTVSAGTTNSLDRRLFQNARKDGKGGAGRSIVGAVKKSVSMLLGHLSAVGDMASAKPRCIETWRSCSDLTQASAKLRCSDACVRLADRQRVAGCQLARELRHNRSEREAQFGDTTNKSSQSSSSSCVIRFRSRDFDTLVSRFATGDHRSAATKTDTS